MYLCLKANETYATLNSEVIDEKLLLKKNF